jgi:hypothetical protein
MTRADQDRAGSLLELCEETLDAETLRLMRCLV